MKETRHCHEHQEHQHEQPSAVTRKWQIGSVVGNALIGTAELATGHTSTLSVAADGLHNVGDAYTYYTQTENILSKKHSEEKKQKRRKLGYWILSGTSAAIAAKAAGDIVFDHDAPQNPLTLFSASASLALNSLLASTLYRNFKKNKKEGHKSEHEHDIVKHLATDTASAALAVGGALAQKYGVSAIEPLAAITGAAITGWAFRPTKKNLEHSHNHFDDHHEHGHDHEHHTDAHWKESMSPIAARLALGVIDATAHTNEYRLHRKHKRAFAKASPEYLSSMIERANELSYESRLKSYEGDNRTFEQKNFAWNESYWNLLQGMVADDVPEALREERRSVIDAIGIDLDDGSWDGQSGLYTQVEQFRQTYVDGEASNIGQFIEDISIDCKDKRGVVDLDFLHHRLEAIAPMLSAFGTIFDVQDLVKDFTFAHGMLTQRGKKSREIAVFAAEKIQQHPESVHEHRLRAVRAMPEEGREEVLYTRSSERKTEGYDNLLLAS